ncbi:MAG: hypothetical protein Q9O62_10330 [Ardenticatenia bacterium]|nr:hypothetical protein [Ardenticatenia bacterium]
MGVRFGFEQASLRLGGTVDRLAGMALGLIITSGFFWGYGAHSGPLNFMTSVPLDQLQHCAPVYPRGHCPLLVGADDYNDTPRASPNLCPPWMSGYLPPSSSSSFP